MAEPWNKNRKWDDSVVSLNDGDEVGWKWKNQGTEWSGCLAPMSWKGVGNNEWDWDWEWNLKGEMRKENWNYGKCIGDFLKVSTEGEINIAGYGVKVERYSEDGSLIEEVTLPSFEGRKSVTAYKEVYTVV